MRNVWCLLVAQLIILAHCDGEVHFEERFLDESLKKWIIPTVEESELGEWKVAKNKQVFDESEDQGLKTTQDAKFYRISKMFQKPFSNKGKNLCVQFSVAHEQKIDCGGGYVKLFGKGFDPKEMDSKTDYEIMFGPDYCGYSNSLVHAIFSYKGKNHLIKQEISYKVDELTHLYTLIVKPDNTFEVLIDAQSKRKGSLADDWDMLLPKRIDDPTVSKPEDWVDEKMMDDPEDKKPDNWDDIPESIADPEAKKPEDWNDETDGDWAPPVIPNPEYKGEWHAKVVENPAYKGEWKHPQIDNPDYKDDPELYAREFTGIGFDLWQVKSGTIFDNIIISTELEACEQHAEKYWRSRHTFEEAGKKKDTKDEKMDDKTDDEIFKEVFGTTSNIDKKSKDETAHQEL